MALAHDTRRDDPQRRPPLRCHDCGRRSIEAGWCWFAVLVGERRAVVCLACAEARAAWSEQRP